MATADSFASRPAPPADHPPRRRANGVPSSKIGNVAALAKLTRSIAPAEHDAVSAEAGDDAIQRRRRLVAAFCRLLGEQLNSGQSPRPADPALSRRERQTLERLLAGDGEKQIAAQFRLSPHTVHVYVKSLYKRFGVCSRSELLARWIRR